MDKEKLEQMLTCSSKVVGSKQVLKGISNSTVRCVIVALDADVEVRKKIVEKAKAHRIDIVYVPSKRKLGEQAGVEVATAVVGIIQSKGIES